MLYFLQIKGKTLRQQKDYDCFIAVIWNQTHESSEVGMPVSCPSSNPERPHELKHA